MTSALLFNQIDLCSKRLEEQVILKVPHPGQQIPKLQSPPRTAETIQIPDGTAGRRSPPPPPQTFSRTSI